MNQRKNISPEIDLSVIEQLKSYYLEHDFTKDLPVSYNPANSTPEHDAIFAKAKKFFALAWLDQMKALGLKQRMNNYSEDYPVKYLSKVDATYIAQIGVQLCNNPDKFDNAITQYCAQVFPLIEHGCNVYASKRQRKVEDLTEDELFYIFDEIVTLYMNEMVKMLMVAQQVPEIAGISQSNAAHSDFNPGVVENRDRTDFLRRWDHIRSKIGRLLSWEELQEDTEDEDGTPRQWEHARNFFDDSDDDYDAEAENQRLELFEAKFLEALDSVEQEIYRMRKLNYSQEMIASALGYRSHSAVTKRLQKMRVKFDQTRESLKG